MSGTGYFQIEAHSYGILKKRSIPFSSYVSMLYDCIFLVYSINAVYVSAR